MKTFFQLRESSKLDEMKMNDPKLLKVFDKLKKGSTVKLKTSSTISKGKDFVEYIVKSKNTVNKGRVEKITLATVGNEGAVKKFLYKRDGTVGFAIGDMGASIDDIKEGTWALPDSPKAKAELKKLMSKPIKLGKGGDEASDKLYALIGDDKLFDDLYVAGKKNPNGDARDVVKKHMKRLGIKEEVDLDEAVAYKFAAVDRLGKVIGFASDERDAKDMARRGHTMDSPSKGKGVVGRNSGRVVTLKKPLSPKKGDMMINRPFPDDMDKFPTNTSATQGKRMGEEIKEVDENKKMNSDALKRAMDAFKKSGGKVKIVAPGKAQGAYGDTSMASGVAGQLSKADTSRFKTKKGGKIKSMSAGTQYDEDYQVQKYTNGKKDGAAKSFGGNLKKATAHADKMGGDHRVHKVTIDRPDRLTSLRVSKDKPPFNNPKPIQKNTKDKFGNPIKNRARYLARKAARDLLNKAK